MALWNGLKLTSWPKDLSSYPALTIRRLLVLLLSLPLSGLSLLWLCIVSGPFANLTSPMPFFMAR